MHLERGWDTVGNIESSEEVSDLDFEISVRHCFCWPIEILSELSLCPVVAFAKFCYSFYTISFIKVQERALLSASKFLSTDWFFGTFKLLCGGFYRIL